MCLLGGHVLWPRLRLVTAAAAAIAAAAAAAVVVAAAAAAVAPAAVVVAAACMDTVNHRSHCSLDGAIDEDAPRSP